MTGVTIVARPRDGKVTLRVEPNIAVRLRGLVTSSSGQRIAGAKVSLLWTRWHPPEKEQRPPRAVTIMLATYTTTDDGLFVFRNLWPGDNYNVEVEARGHTKGEISEITAKPGETHDLGTIVLINTDAALSGRVVGSDGRPIVGAEVFRGGGAGRCPAPHREPRRLLPGARLRHPRPVRR
jgi:hypothetical protein